MKPVKSKGDPASPDPGGIERILTLYTFMTTRRELFLTTNV